jgi:methyl-accepting chemotaxis protein
MIALNPLRAFDEAATQEALFRAFAAAKFPEYRTFRMFLRRGEAVRGEFKRVAKDGREVWVDEIAASAQEQSVGLSEIHSVINQMDQMTQANAAMAKETTATTQTLAAEIKGVMSLLARFETRLASYARPEASPLGPLRRLPARL